jgi:SAM-dependent methyltransferase
VPPDPESTTLDNPRGHDVNLRSAPQLREYEAIAARVASDAPGSVLDWGCGFGQMSDLLRRAGVAVKAFDYWPHLEAPTVQPLERFPEIRAHLSPEPVRLPFADGAFDAVLSCGVLEHVEHPADSLMELKRVLLPGGTFYVYKLPNRASYLEWIAKRMGLYYHGAYPHDRVYDKRSALALLRGQGFEVLEFRRRNMLPLSLTGGAAARAAGAIWAANRALSRVPGVNRLATNLEVVVRAPS